MNPPTLKPEAREQVHRAEKAATSTFRDLMKKAYNPQTTTVNYMHFFGVAPAIYSLKLRPDLFMYVPHAAIFMFTVHTIAAYYKRMAPGDVRSYKINALTNQHGMMINALHMFGLAPAFFWAAKNPQIASKYVQYVAYFIWAHQSTAILMKKSGMLDRICKLTPADKAAGVQLNVPLK